MDINSKLMNLIQRNNSEDDKERQLRALATHLCHLSVVECYNSCRRASPHTDSEITRIALYGFFNRIFSIMTHSR